MMNSNVPQARRARKLRSVLSPDGTGRQFARWIGMPETRWNNYERGYPLTISAITKVRAAFPYSGLADYLLFGKPGGLPYHLALSLDFPGSLRPDD